MEVKLRKRLTIFSLLCPRCLIKVICHNSDDSDDSDSLLLEFYIITALSACISGP
jgi:hypothetical protein